MKLNLLVQRHIFSLKNPGISQLVSEEQDFGVNVCRMREGFRSSQDGEIASQMSTVIVPRGCDLSRQEGHVCMGSAELGPQARPFYSPLGKVAVSGPWAHDASAVLEWLRALRVTFACTGHGPVARFEGCFLGARPRSVGEAACRACDRGFHEVIRGF